MIAELLIIVLAYLLLSAMRSRSSHGDRRFLPPGPTGLPLLGSLLSMPMTYHWLFFEKLLKRYGPIVTLKVAHKTIILVGSAEIAHDLFDIQGATNILRPTNALLQMTIRNKAMVTTQDLNGWKTSRSLMAQVLSKVKTGSTEHMQRSEAIFTIQRLLKTPSGWMEEFDRFSGTVLTDACYAEHLTSSHSGRMKQLRELVSELVKIMGPAGGSIVAQLPFLDRLPLPSAICKPWRAYSERIRQGLEDVFDDLTNRALALEAKGVETWTSQMFQSPLAADIQRTACTIPFQIGDLYEAGSDTTLIALHNILFLALLNPDKLLWVQEELDSVFGDQQVPDFSLRELCPRTTAFVRESLRLRPPAPTGIPRVMNKDTWLTTSKQRYLISKDAIVFYCVWTIEHDAVRYPDPLSFRPERHISPDGDLKEGETSVFGYGRRACPGAPMAQRTIYIMTALLFWLFNVLPLEDVSKYNQLDGTGDLTSYPLPFRANLVPRSEVRTALVQAHELSEQDFHLM